LELTEEVEIIEYASSVFESIKEMDGISREQIRESLSTELNRERAFKAGES
jgi:hypothetical protein